MFGALFTPRVGHFEVMSTANQELTRLADTGTSTSTSISINNQTNHNKLATSIDHHRQLAPTATITTTATTAPPYQDVTGRSDRISSHIHNKATSSQQASNNQQAIASKSSEPSDQLSQASSSSLASITTIATTTTPTTGEPYQLRALSGNSIEAQPGNNRVSETKPEPSISGKYLSLDLIDETLNYFINCKHRLNQFIKTFKDSDAYIMLVQEKQEDLELVARFGKTMLKENKELKELLQQMQKELSESSEVIGQLQNELGKCQEDKRQLEHQLASKVSLLNAYMEEENFERRDRESPQHDKSTLLIEDSQPDSLRFQTEISYTSSDTELVDQLLELKDELSEVKSKFLDQQKQLEFERDFQRDIQIKRLLELEQENETLKDNQEELCNVIKTHSLKFDRISEALQILAESQRECRQMSSDRFNESYSDTSLCAHCINSDIPFMSLASECEASIAASSPCADKKNNWTGLSKFTLTSVILFCLSVTLNSSAHKIQQIKLNR